MRVFILYKIAEIEHYLRPIILFILICDPFSIQAQASEPIILEHADKAEFMGFLSVGRIVTLSGRVKVSFKGVQLEADYVQIDLEKGFISAKGNVTLYKPERTLKAEELVYDLNTEVALTLGVEAKVEGFCIEGEEIKVEQERRMIIKEGFFTTCDYKPPHYRIKASRVVIYPKRSLWARDIVFYLGKLPLFYSPIYYRSLRDKGPHLFISPGYAKRDGWYLRSKYRVYLEDDYLDLLLDYFQRRGFGEGIDYQYRSGKDAIGRISLYHMNEKEILYGKESDRYYNPDHPTYRERWKFFLSHYQNLLKDLTFTGRLDYRSDESIDYDIERGDYPRIRDLDSFLALTLRKTDYIVRASSERKDSWDGKSFVKEREEAPRLKIWQRPLAIGPLYYQFKTDLVNEYKGKEYNLKADLKSRLFTCLNIGPSFSLSPEIGLREKEKQDLLASLTLQARISRWFRYDLAYKLTKEIKETRPELEEIQGLVYILFPKWYRMRVENIYDLVSKQYQPLIFELNLCSSRGFNLDATSRYQIGEGVFRGLSLAINKDSQRWEAGMGAYFVKLNNKDNPFDLEGRLGIWLTSKMKARLKSRYDNGKKEFEFWEASLYRDLHCWELELGLRHQPLYLPTAGRDTEGWFKLNLKGF